MKIIKYYNEEIFLDDDEYEKYKNEKVIVCYMSGRKSVFVKDENGKVKTLSRLILRLDDINLFALFKDNNSLNLTKKNMQIIHRSELYRYRRPYNKKYKGTGKEKRTNRFNCVVYVQSRNRIVSVYDTEIQAAKKYDLACDYLKLHGYRNFDKEKNKEILTFKEIQRLEKIKKND